MTMVEARLRRRASAHVLNYRSTPSLKRRVTISVLLLLVFLSWNPAVVLQVAAQKDFILEDDEVDGVNVDNNVNNNIDSKTRPNLEDFDPDSDESFLRRENGIIVLESLGSVRKVLQQEESTNGESSTLILALIHASSCPHSLALIKRVEEAYLLLTDYFETTTDKVSDLKKPVFAKLDGSTSDLDPADLLKAGVDVFPTLVFVAGDSNIDTHTLKYQPFMLEYTGRQETAEDIYRTVLHYFHQLIVAAGDVHRTGAFVDVKPKEFDTMMDVTDFLRDHKHGILDHTVVKPGFPVTISAESQEYISWLMSEDNPNHTDDFLLLVQCRNKQRQSGKSRPYYESFEHMARVVSSRRDRLFVTITDCDDDATQGSVVAWKIPFNFDLDGDMSVPTSSFSPSLSTDQSNSSNDHDLSQELIEFIVKVSTPSILWFDRQATAPIAFPKYRKVHAVLFVDLHRIEQGMDQPFAIKSRDMIRRFRSTCRDHWREDETTEQDMVCLVVPSTETRVLTTFGIDIWTVLDERVSQSQPGSQKKEWTEPLPSLVLTDQRGGGTKRYYLDSTVLSASIVAIPDFVDNFWQGSLTPQQKSSKLGARTNNSGVRILTGDTFRTEILQADSDRHALIFFSAPTCGHCKRFSILWNQLAELIAYVEWDSFLTLYEMDVTTNEIVDLDVISVKWLPDVYYFSPQNRTSPVRYDLTDEQGEGVGRLGSPMEIIQWLIQEGDFEDSQLRKLLLGLNKKDGTTAK
jgi:thiol-disulfide isomerase/thioredoxin